MELIQMKATLSSYLDITLKVASDCMTNITTAWTKKAEIPDFSPLWFFFFLLDQDSCSDSNGGCTHQCVQGPFGAQCLCPSGYLLANDSKTCEDIDECNVPGFCSQHCFNTRGSFRCWCDEEYTLDTDGRTCKVTGNDWTWKCTNSSQYNSTLQSLRSNVAWRNLTMLESNELKSWMGYVTSLNLSLLWRLNTLILIKILAYFGK